MSLSKVAGRFRDASLVVLGAFLASAVSMSVAAAPTAPAATQTRVFSCAGFNFAPIDSRTNHRWDGRKVWRTDNAGDGWFMCPAVLPHRAVVTKVRFPVNDLSSDIDLRYCALFRVPLAVSGAASAVAAVAATGLEAQPGTVRRTTTTITGATVDNSRFAYLLQCQYFFDTDLGLAGPFGGIIGADVTYTISSANG